MPTLTSGKEHPATLASAAGLGYVFRDSGCVPEALEWTTVALEGRRVVLGDAHAETLESALTLANLLQMAERSDEALNLAESCAEAGSCKTRVPA